MLIKPVLAQDTTKPVAYYLDDKDISTARNTIKIEPICIVQGEYAVVYERFLTKRFIAEVTAGMLNKNYRYELIDFKDPDSKLVLEPEKPGYVAGLVLGLYGEKGHDGLMAQLGYKYRHFKELYTQDFFCCAGVQFIIHDRYPLQFGVDLGVRLQNSMDDKNYAFDSDSDFIPFGAIRLRFGILY